MIIMITEDYVSYEVAKLLKEKGFDEKCSRWYVANEPQEGIVEKGFGENQFYINAPTHQMVMKWLRDKKNILIYVYPVINLPVTDDDTLFHWRWDGKQKIYSAPHIGDKHNYESYEEAVEAALKYSLENLI